MQTQIQPQTDPNTLSPEALPNPGNPWREVIPPSVEVTNHAAKVESAPVPVPEVQVEPSVVVRDALVQRFKHIQQTNELQNTRQSKRRFNRS